MSPREARAPQQSRALKTVAAILDAATAVLAEHGYDILSTNNIAAAAGINISTLYSYFPNKQAILERLLERYNQRLVERLQTLLANDPDRHRRVALIIEAQVKLMNDEPWIFSLKQALANHPALAELQTRCNQQLIDTVLTQIPQRVAGPKLKGAQQQRVMRLLVDSFNRGVLMVAKEPPRGRKKMLAEVSLMINSYLDNYRD